MQIKRKGIILAGGKGSRLYPITKAISKQLLPIYDKPMIYYPLSTLMMSGIKDILIITNPSDNDIFKRLLGDGHQWGIRITYAIQKKPQGIAQAFQIGESFICEHPVALALGDNLFHGDSLQKFLYSAASFKSGASLMVYPVKDPERYGVVEFNKNNEVINIEEKPKKPKSNYVITGLYFYDSTVIKKSKEIQPSERGELEISDINLKYLKENNLKVNIMGRGMAWLDTGTYESLHEASGYIKTLEHRQGLKVGCPEETAWRMGWIDNEQLIKLGEKMDKSNYGDYLINLKNINKVSYEN